MILFKKSSDLTTYINQKRSEGLRIGFVPTMGALHDGHLSLLRLAKQTCDLVVLSIFVNPTQFNQVSDLNSYPRPIENDIRLLLEDECDVLFHPEVSELYGSNLIKDSSEDYGPFIHVLEGASRPGHFDGVITIVKKLFILCLPHEVFFGQKDYQQCLVIQTLIQRNFPHIEFNLCPISREPDGLARSSRNIHLNKIERELAPEIFKALQSIQQNWTEPKWENAVKDARVVLSKSPFVFEYLSICDPQTLAELTHWQEQAVVLVAVKLGNTRLIDNVLLGKGKTEVVNDK